MRRLLVFFLLMNCVQIGTRGEVVDGKYNDLTIFIDEDLDVEPNKRDEFITKLENLLTDASSALFTATSEKLYLGSVYIIIPPSWNNIDADEMGFILGLEPHIQVSNEGLGGKAPFTLQGGSCGGPGLKMSLPLQFLMDEELQSEYGDPGKIIANEFLKLMYGVYDELGYPGDPWAPYAFYDVNEDVTRVTSCTESESLKGSWKDKDGDDCTPSETDLYCRMKITGSEANFSTLFVTHIENIERVCNNATHDYVAPTIHNRLCGVSTMSVLMRHADFQDSGSGSLLLGPIFPPDTTPVFSVIRMQYLSTLILLDQNGGDIETEVFKIHDQVKLAIEILLKSKNIEKFGFGLFDDSDTVSYFSGDKNPLQPIQDINVDDIIDFFPKTLGEAKVSAPSFALDDAITRTDSLLLKDAVNILVIQVQKTKRKDEDNRPELDQTSRTFYVSQVLYLGDDSDESLEKIEDYLTGKLHVDYRYEATVASSVLLSLASNVERIVLVSEVLTAGNVSVYDHAVLIDPTIGINTLFQVTWEENGAGNVTLRDPDGKAVAPTDLDSNIFLIEDAQDGYWTLRLASGNNMESVAQILVTTQARGGEDQIHMKLWSSAAEEEHDLATSPLVLYASLRKGPNPVVGAHVSVKLYALGALNMDVMLPLGDNGYGTPDLTLGDGVYSCYLNRINEFGLDSDGLEIFADLLVTPPEPKDSYSYGTYSFEDVPVQSRAMTVNPFFDDPMPNATEVAFERTMFNALSFKVTGAKDYDPPPSAIVDFKMVKIDGGLFSSDTVELVLSWSAPGEDFTEGKVKSYELKYTDTPENLEDFDSWTNVEEDLIIDGSLDPLEQGMKQTVTLKFDKSPVTIFLAIRALDKAGNKGELSPRVSANGNYSGVYVAPTAPPPTSVTTESYSTIYVHDDFVGSAGFIILIIFCVIVVIVGVGLVVYSLTKDDDLITKFKKKKNRRRSSSHDAHHNHMTPP